MVHYTITVVIIKASVVAQVNVVIPQPRYEKFFYPALSSRDSSCDPVNG